jgi:hypothetical protein
MSTDRPAPGLQENYDGRAGLRLPPALPPEGLRSYILEM